MNVNVQESRTQIGARIRQVRELRGMLRYQLADKAGKSAAYIGQVESGLKGCSISTLTALADALEVTPDILLGKRELDVDDLAG